MTKLRDHNIFAVTVMISMRKRIEDDLGELTGYGDPYDKKEILNVVAPSRSIAEAWVLYYRRALNPRVVDVVETKLHGFIQDHIW